MSEVFIDNSLLKIWSDGSSSNLFSHVRGSSNEIYWITKCFNEVSTIASRIRKKRQSEVFSITDLTGERLTTDEKKIFIGQALMILKKAKVSRASFIVDRRMLNDPSFAHWATSFEDMSAKLFPSFESALSYANSQREKNKPEKSFSRWLGIL
jgi:hypothetical protein